MRFRGEVINCTLDNGVNLTLIDTPDQAELQAEATLFWRPFEREHWPLCNVVNVDAKIVVSQPAVRAGVFAIIIAGLVSMASWQWGGALALMGLAPVFFGGGVWCEKSRVI